VSKGTELEAKNKRVKKKIFTGVSSSSRDGGLSGERRLGISKYPCPCLHELLFCGLWIRLLQVGCLPSVHIRYISARCMPTSHVGKTITIKKKFKKK